MNQIEATSISMTFFALKIPSQVTLARRVKSGDLNGGVYIASDDCNFC